jgi:hypothetical protein
VLHSYWSTRKSRPNIWRLLLALRQEQASTEIVLQQIAAGQRVHKSLPAYKKNTKTATETSTSFLDRTTERFAVYRRR